MRVALLLLVITQVLQEVPYKPQEEYDLKMSFELRNRATSSTPTFYFDRDAPHQRADVNLPALIAKVIVTRQQPDEVRYVVRNEKGDFLSGKKVSQGMEIDVDMGFIADIKDGVSPQQYIITFLNKHKEPQSRIEIVFRNGQEYYVNGEKRGAL